MQFTVENDYVTGHFEEFPVSYFPANPENKDFIFVFESLFPSCIPLMFPLFVTDKMP